MVSLTYKQLLVGNRSFRRLWFGQVISELGNWFNFIAGLGLVNVVSGGAPNVTALLLVTRQAPFSLFAPIAGVLVDRYSRKTVMIVSDLARAVFALGFLLVKSPEHLWWAYVCSIIMALLTALFEAAKNAAMPNITGDEGLLAGNTLMFSSRFLLMSIGAALGGWASGVFGYEIAFIINAISFLVSAFYVWLIDKSEMKQKENEAVSRQKPLRLLEDLKEGFSFVKSHRLVATIMLTNIIWAIGGGLTHFLTYELGAKVFATGGWFNADNSVAALYAAGGFGLFVGMMFARRVGTYVEIHKKIVVFIGVTLLAHGLIFGLSGYVPHLWMACLLFMISRAILGVEFGVQDTLFVRLVPDNLRGRVVILDRAAEMLVWNMATYIAGWTLFVISPSILTLIAGLLASGAGLFWFLSFARKKMVIPEFETVNKEETEPALSAN